MQMNPHPAAGGHPLMSPGVNPHGIQRPDGSIIKGQNIPGMEAIARCVVSYISSKAHEPSQLLIRRSHHPGIWENCRAAYEDIVKHLERLREERGDDRTPNVDHKPRDLSSQGSGLPLTDSPNGQSPALNLSKSGVGDHGASGGGAAGGGSGPQSERSNPISPEPSVHEEDENISEANISDTEEPNDKDEDISDCERDIHSPVPAVIPIPQEIEAHRQQALNYSSLAASVAVGAVPTGQDPNISSTETLLRNIQGLLKVAADNARQQERQTSYEKALYQKRFKKERRLRIQIQERLDGERKRRVQLEDIIKASGAPAEALRIIADNISSDQQQREKERERDSEREKDRDKERERDRDRREQRDKGQEREREHHHQQSSSASERNRDRGVIEESLRADRHRVEAERE
uniref:Dachshund n=1 Tax=Anopheles maculatus TaxID=74869 RepID=A0A182T532_9DIPT